MLGIGQSQIRMALLGTALLGVTSAVQASTVAYWRFEGDSTAFLSDSSGNGHTLTAAGTTPATQVASFENPYPGAQANNNAASFPGGATGAAGNFTTPDAAEWDSQELTVEALINFSSTGAATKIITSHFGAAPNRSWYFGLITTSATAGTLRMFSDINGSNSGGTVQWNSTFTLTAGVDYYIAMVRDFDVTTGTAQPVTFYVKDLTNNTAMLTETVTNPTGDQPSLIDSASLLSIGATGTGSSPFTGVIDELRISDSIVAVGDLLVNQPVPEPASVGLLALGALAILGRRRAA